MRLDPAALGLLGGVVGLWWLIGHRLKSKTVVEGCAQHGRRMRTEKREAACTEMGQRLSIDVRAEVLEMH